MTNDVSKIVENFLSSLEKRVLDLQLQIENLQAKNKEYDDLEKIIDAINESKIDFSIEFLNGDTKEIVELLERVIEDKDRVSFYLSQITNYYYLYETNLLNTEVTLDQTTYAEQALTDLVEELKEYQSKIDVIKNRETIKELRALEEKIVSFGVKFGYIEDQEETVDLDLFIELMETSRLSEEEKIQLLQTVIKNNVASYEKQLLIKDTNVKDVFEHNQEAALVELGELEELEEETVIAKVSEETLEAITKLLKDPEIIRRLVKIIETTQEIEISIDGKAYIEDQQETVDEALQLAKEEIVELLENETAKTPEEALDIFMEANDDELYEAELVFEEIFGEEEVEDTKNVDEYLELIQRGIEFYDQHKKLLLNITVQEKDSIDNYARGLYHNKGNRTIVYKSKNFDGNNKTILKEATYEISVLLNMFKQLEIGNKLTSNIIIKTGRRISEIMESVELAKEYEVSPKVNPKETKKKGTVYFLGKGTVKDRTFYEDEIGVGSYNKGISSSYYKDLLFQLEQIENRGQIRIPSIRPNNGKSYPYTADFGVRLISSNRTSTYFIPVGSDDAIIVGVRFIDTGDDYRKTLENRLRAHSTKIEELIEKVNSAENKEEAKRYVEEIKKILSQGEKSKKEPNDEVESMFEVPPVEIIKPKHI